MPSLPNLFLEEPECGQRGHRSRTCRGRVEAVGLKSREEQGLVQGRRRDRGEATPSYLPLKGSQVWKVPVETLGLRGPIRAVSLVGVL